jgi:hypothetical protein
MSDPWPFTERPDEMAVSQRTILKEGRPILLVVHDGEDGTWQFLDGGEFRTEAALLVTLKTVLAHDASMATLADLEPGWQARRAGPGSPWVRERCV